MNKVENPDRSTWEDLLKRPTQTYEQIEGSVLEIFDAIKKTGQRAYIINPHLILPKIDLQEDILAKWNSLP